ncbi:rod shape-determining protein RodA [Thermodesulfobacteriota bacterium]
MTIVFDRRLVLNFDWGYFFLIIILSGIGIINLYSASYSFEETAKAIYIRQMYWLGLGICLMLITFVIDYRQYEQYAYFIYFLSIVLLTLVLISGKVAGGSQRWLQVGPFRVQASEFMKISITLALAKYFHKERGTDIYSLRDLIIPMLMVALPMILIIKEPDLGSALMIMFIAIAVIFFNKIDKRSLLVIIIAGLILTPFSWYMLKDYQKQRIRTLFSSDIDPQSSGYHIIQSKIAVGSGLFSGKGFMQGTQSQLRFLPEHHTDFIFSVLAEEWGFLGCFIVLILFLALLLWGINISTHSKDKFGAIVAFGITAMLFFQIVINIGMVIGIMPVVGITLPLFSYGGSSMISVFICFGLMFNISMRKFL